MRLLVLSLATVAAFAGPGLAQTNAGGPIAPQVVRGETAKPNPSAKKAVTPPKTVNVQKAAVQQKAVPKKVTPQKTATGPRKTTPEQLRAARYGGFAPAAPLPAPELDTTSPRSLSLINFNTKEELTVTYWSNGAYHRVALDQLNNFLRDSRDNTATEMDPLLFDVLWHTMRVTGYAGSVEVLSSFRSPTTNAWLASVSRGVARDSQHMNGNAMDIRFPGVPVFRIRQAARSLNMGGVGFYPRSGFVHIDTGPVRYW
jgi:uncharacterized protein YcbK (DUF882 family)